MFQKYGRRKFLRRSTMAGVGFSLMNAKAFATEKKSRVRIGLIAVGGRGQVHLTEMLKRADVEVVAMADPDRMMMGKAQKIAGAYNKQLPAEYPNGDFDYRNLLQRDDIDAVIISSPWGWHLRHAVDAMNAGKIVGLEVGCALTLDDCWEFVNTYERTGTPIMILENVCYRRDIMAVQNMVRLGMFGELLHVQGGYQHDMRARKFNDGVHPDTDGVEFGEKTSGTPKWRTQYSIDRNGDLYPTHGLGPVAGMLYINRGNLLTSLSSVATKARGLHRYIIHHPMGGVNHPNAQIKFKLGDIVTTQIQTANEETILLTHDTSSPRPYNLGFRVQGVNGIWQEYGAGEFSDGSIFFEDRSPDHTWESPEKYIRAYDHPAWKDLGREVEKEGHGGMDYFVDDAFIECIKRNVPFPLDVYDLATWYAITPISEMSVREGGRLQTIPDFTRGKWRNRRPD